MKGLLAQDCSHRSLCSLHPSLGLHLFPPPSPPRSRLRVGSGDLSYSGMGQVLVGQASKTPDGRGVSVSVLL